MNLAETGHLVFYAHTSGSVQTINRLIQFFSPDIQHSSCSSCRLTWSPFTKIDSKIGGGRVGIHELMYITPAIKNLIKSGDLVQINNNIELGSQEGMITMRNSADKLRDARLGMRRIILDISNDEIGRTC